MRCAPHTSLGLPPQVFETYAPDGIKKARVMNGMCYGFVTFKVRYVGAELHVWVFCGCLCSMLMAPVVTTQHQLV